MARNLPLLGAAVLPIVCLVASVQADNPKTLYWDGGHMAATKKSPEHSSGEVQQSLDGLKKNAELALNRGPYSVVDKQIVPPSGDKHDYLSFSRYWWPNPDTPDGLPYVRRDGEVNRTLLSQGDRVRIGMFFDDVESLSLAAYLLDDQEYGHHAAGLIRAWFIAPETRMNPNLNFGQGVPGRAHGRGVGIIDTRHFIRVLDSVALLDAMGVLSEADQTEFQGWFRQYLTWLTTSPLGKQERRASNNHGCWYAAQTARIALFVGDRDRAKEILEEVRAVRIPRCFAEDGGQPEELVRTRSLHYSLFSLEALTIAARLGESADVDLWGVGKKGEVGLKRGLDFVTPFVLTPDSWPYPVLGDFEVTDQVKQLYRLSYCRWKDRQYLPVINCVSAREDDRQYSSLLFAPP